MSVFLSTLFLSLFITISLVPLFTKLALRFQIVDIPDKRKVHARPVPRIGGAAMALAIFAVCLAFVPKDDFVNAFLIGAGIIIAFGLADDLFNLGYKTKFAGQIAAALVVIFYGDVKIVTLGNLIPAELCLSDWGSVLLTLLVIVGTTNAINLSDGLDGLAAGISLLAFCCIAYLAYRTGMGNVMFIATAMAGAIFGFLRFNTYPATTFMGDGGSQLLGFSGIVLSIKLTQASAILSTLLPLYLFGLPILDTLLVMYQRVSEGRSPFHPDKNHIHHKLMRLGLFHTEAVFVIYLIQSVLVTATLFFSTASERILLLGYLIFAFTVLAAFIAAERYKIRMDRPHYIDKKIKARLKVLKEKGVLIRFLFMSLKVALIAILLVAAMIPARIPPVLTLLGALSFLILMLTLFTNKVPGESAVRLVYYVSVPYLIYLGTSNPIRELSAGLGTLYDLSFMLLAFLGIMTLKFTRRKKGFRFSTMDFLILVIISILIFIPDEQVKSYHLGLLASKIIILFFSFEILVGELRGEVRGLVLTTMLVCFAIVFRGFDLLVL